MPELSFGEAVAEAQSEEHPADEAGAVTVSADEFAALEERVLRAVNLVKRERLARAAAEERASSSRVPVGGTSPKPQRISAAKSNPFAPSARPCASAWKSSSPSLTLWRPDAATA